VTKRISCRGDFVIPIEKRAGGVNDIEGAARYHFLSPREGVGIEPSYAHPHISLFLENF
jgi:hypothetical protein